MTSHLPQEPQEPLASKQRANKEDIYVRRPSLTFIFSMNHTHYSSLCTRVKQRQHDSHAQLSSTQLNPLNINVMSTEIRESENPNASFLCHVFPSGLKILELWCDWPFNKVCARQRKSLFILPQLYRLCGPKSRSCSILAVKWIVTLQAEMMDLEVIRELFLAVWSFKNQ